MQRARGVPAFSGDVIGHQFPCFQQPVAVAIAQAAYPPGFRHIKPVLMPFDAVRSVHTAGNDLDTVRQSVIVSVRQARDLTAAVQGDINLAVGSNSHEARCSADIIRKDAYGKAIGHDQAFSRFIRRR